MTKAKETVATLSKDVVYCKGEIDKLRDANHAVPNLIHTNLNKYRFEVDEQMKAVNKTLEVHTLHINDNTHNINSLIDGHKEIREVVKANTEMMGSVKETFKDCINGLEKRISTYEIERNIKIGQLKKTAQFISMVAGIVAIIAFVIKYMG